MNIITTDINTRSHTDEERRDQWKRNAKCWSVVVEYQGRRMSTSFFTGYLTYPTTWDVVYCLLSDAQYIEAGQTFEEYCADVGLNHDSIRDLKVYRQTVKQTRNLKRLLGDDFERFMAMDLEEELTAHCAS